MYAFTLTTADLGIYTALKLLGLDPAQELIAASTMHLVGALMTIALKLGRVKGMFEASKR